jgi:hypothetical protein
MGTANRLLAPLIFSTLCVFTTSGAQARLGESINNFRAKAAASFKFKTETKKEDRSYYMFTMTLDDKTKEGAPGFAGGLTLTVVDNKIVGQSMILRLGDNYEGGKALATLHCMDFAYESIGKPAPKNKQNSESEYAMYGQAIDQVLAGSSQHVKYPGFNDKITMSRTNDGDLLIAVTPDLSSDPAKPDANKPTNKMHP